MRASLQSRATHAFTFALALAVTACAEAERDDAGDTAGAVVGAEDSASVGAQPPMGAGDISGSEAEPGGDEATGDPAATIPARFHGEWNADRAACGTGTSETRLRISADEIRFHESVGDVSAVERVGDDVVAVSATYIGEGETWQDERRLTLSPDGASLTVSGGGDLVRHRCP